MQDNFTPDFDKHLPKEFFLQDTVTVARQLIGKILVKKLTESEYLAGKIVETEAYLAKNDLASHSAPGRTKRNAPMFDEGGILYVYKIYGVHHCINFVTEGAGTGAAVLLRALEPISGISNMLENRKCADVHNLCKGPGNVAKAFKFNIEDNCRSLCTEDLFIRKSSDNCPPDIIVSKRIGITRSATLPLRFYHSESDFVSRIKK